MILFGASGHSKVVLDILISNGVTVALIIDDNPKTTEIFSVPVSQNQISDFHQSALIVIGNNSARKKIAEKYPFNYVQAIHPDASISKFATLGSGTVVMARAAVNPDAVIGKHCIINTGAVIEHDCEIDDFVHISPSASLAGNVSVAEGAHVGIGASVIQGVKIGKWATIGAGAVIIRDVPDYATVVGNPGKIIKINKNIH